MPLWTRNTKRCLMRILRRRGSYGNAIVISSPRQDDFAKWPILNQMAQGFARILEGIDPLDNRLY
jgi:hypothetical protein